MLAKKNPVAGVILKNDAGEYLLVQEKQPNAYGLWNLPAGWIDKDESASQAAVREAKEEVGFDVELLDNQPFLTCLNDAKDRELNSFRAKIIGGELKFQEDELLNARWFSIEEVIKLSQAGELRNKWTLESIKKADESTRG